jgi:hypothetical protein
MLISLSEIQCAQYVATESDAGLTTTYVSSGTSSAASPIESSTRSSSVTQQERENKKPITYVATDAELSSSVTRQERESDKSITYIATESIISPSVIQQEKESLNDKSIVYVAGSFGALLLIALLGVLVLAFSFAFYVHHQRKKTRKLHMVVLKTY